MPAAMNNIRKSKTISFFHTHLLGAYLLKRKNDLNSFQCKVHNVFDYGTIEHTIRSQILVTEIVKLERAMKKRKAELAKNDQR